MNTQRYIRQINVPELGESGQEKLKNSSALIVGIGGLGGYTAELLVRAGVGRVGIVDCDTVNISNLPRQILYTSDDLGLSKVECAIKKLQAVNPEVIIEGYSLRLISENAAEIASKYDLIIDGTDNLETRYLLDQTASELNKPYIYGAIEGFVGQASVFHHRGAGSYCELFPKETSSERITPPSVINATAAIIGAIQTNEAIKIIIDHPNTLSGKLLRIDSRDYQFNIFEL